MVVMMELLLAAQKADWWVVLDLKMVVNWAAWKAEMSAVGRVDE